MYEFIHNLLADKKGGEIFTCFGVWHFIYIFLAVGVAIFAIISLKDKNQEIKNKTMKLFIHIAFGLYMADFFLMPFAYGEIDMEKLPFHICTATCVLCFLSWHNTFFAKYRTHIALLAFISNLVYLIYPAGVMWYQVHPLSYRVVQTLIFHGVMAAYGLLVLLCGERKLAWRTCYRDVVLLACITAWAILGNTLYNGNVGDYNHFYNWFFVVRDPFYLLPANIAPYIMPIVNIALFFGVEMLVYAIFEIIEKRKSAKGKLKI